MRLVVTTFRGVRPAAGGIVVMNRDLPDTARPGDGLLAARVVVAEQYIGDRPPAFDAGEERVHQCAGVLHQLRHRERAAGEQYDDDWLARARERVHQRLL